MKRTLLLVWILSTTAWLPPAMAVQTQNLYVADVVVTSQSANARTRAITEGLRQVLVKVSGNADVAQLPTLRKQLTAADTFLEQYSYYTIDTEPGMSQLMLHLAFEPRQVLQLLRENKQPIWESDRPQIITWLRVKDADTSYFIDHASSPELTAQLEQIAEQRGLPVTVPLFDLQDLSAIATDNSPHQQMSAFQHASQRYGSDATLVAEIEQVSSTHWRAYWRLLVAGEQFAWQQSGQNEAQVLTIGMNTAADTLAAKFALSTDQQSATDTIILAIDNIDSASDYTRMIRYLQNLDSVSNVQVLSVSSDEVVYQLQLQGGQKALMQAIALNTMLQPIAAADYDQRLQYRLT